jgi:hypothetical protein
VHGGEVSLKGGVAELVEGACLPQYLSVKGVLLQVQEMYPAPPGDEDEFGQLY